MAERRTCSLLFVGPSFVLSQIDPEVFNREAERLGLRERACKYGVAGLRGYELRLVLERLLAHDWPALKRVVIDISLGDGIGFQRRNWLKPRLVEWHTFESVPWLLSYYGGRGRLPLGDQLPQLYAHAKHLFAHYAEIGEGVERLGSLDLFAPSRPETELERNRSRRKVRGRPLGADYDRKVLAMARARRTRGPKYGDDGWALELRSVVRAHDREAYFVIAPVLFSSPVPKRAVRGRDRLVVFDFNDPVRFPELYVESVRGSTSHLNPRGKTIYSELLARELKKFDRRRR